MSAYTLQRTLAQAMTCSKCGAKAPVGPNVSRFVREHFTCTKSAK